MIFPIELILFLKILIFLCLVVGAYQDYKTRTVSNKIILIIVILSIPIIWNQTNFLIPVLLCILFLSLFYYSDEIEKINPVLFANPIGGADTKVFIPLLLGMSTNEIFIFFVIFAFTNIILIFRLWKGIPLFISILFGYFSILILSFLPWVILWIYSE